MWADPGNGGAAGFGRSVDPFLKKDWYDIKAPSLFTQRNVGKTLVTRTQGTKVRATLASVSPVVSEPTHSPTPQSYARRAR